MSRYGRARKKPVEIRFVRATGDNWDEVEAFINARPAHTNRVREYYSDGEDHYIDTLEGTLTISVGDVIIEGVYGEHYPCKPDIFDATYDVIE